MNEMIVFDTKNYNPTRRGEKTNCSVINTPFGHCSNLLDTDFIPDKLSVQNVLLVTSVVDKNPPLPTARH